MLWAGFLLHVESFFFLLGEFIPSEPKFHPSRIQCWVLDTGLTPLLDWSIRMCKCLWITQEAEHEEGEALCRGPGPLIMPGARGMAVTELRVPDIFKARIKRAYLYWVFPFILSITRGCKLLLPPDTFCSEHYFSWFFMNSKLFIFSFPWIFLPSRALTGKFLQSALFYLFNVMLSWIINSHRDPRKLHFKDNISYLLSHEQKSTNFLKFVKCA